MGRVPRPRTIKKIHRFGTPQYTTERYDTWGNIVGRYLTIKFVDRSKDDTWFTYINFTIEKNAPNDDDFYRLRGELCQLLPRLILPLSRTFLNSNLFTFNLRNYIRGRDYYQGTSKRGLDGMDEIFFSELLTGDYVDESDEPVDIPLESFSGLTLNITVTP